MKLFIATQSNWSLAHSQTVPCHTVKLFTATHSNWSLAPSKTDRLHIVKLTTATQSNWPLAHSPTDHCHTVKLITATQSNWPLPHSEGDHWHTVKSITSTQSNWPLAHSPTDHCHTVKLITATQSNWPLAHSQTDHCHTVKMIIATQSNWSLPHSAVKPFIATQSNSQTRDFEQGLRKRGYSKTLVKTILSEAQFENREEAVQCKPKQRNEILRFVTTYNPAVPNKKKIVMKHWYIIQNQPCRSQTQTGRKEKSLKIIVPHAKIPAVKSQSK